MISTLGRIRTPGRPHRGVPGAALVVSAASVVAGLVGYLMPALAGLIALTIIRPLIPLFPHPPPPLEVKLIGARVDVGFLFIFAVASLGRPGARLLRRAEALVLAFGCFFAITGIWNVFFPD